MTKICITAGPFNFDAKLEREAAPETCAAFEAAMPFLGKIVHVRWSGEGVWAVSYTHLRAHETPEHLVCRLLLEKKKNQQ